jgi:hypothetical protein
MLKLMSDPRFPEIEALSYVSSRIEQDFIVLNR